MTESKLNGVRQVSFGEIRRAAWLSCLVLGLALHLFVFTNLIPNSDGLSRMYEEQQMTVSGRWFLHYASMFHGFLQAPALIGMLSLGFLSASAVLTADVLEIRRIPTAVAVGASFVMIPALAYTYLFTFTASAYSFAVLLAVGSVWLVQKKKYGFFPAALLLACSLGTYQAYFAMAASLALIRVLLDLTDPQKPVDQVVRRGIRFLLMLAASAVLYAVLLMIFLKVKHLELLEYRGMKDLAHGGSAGQLLWGVLMAVKELIAYFLWPAASFSSVPLAVLHGVFLLLAAGAAVYLLVQNQLWKEPLRLVLLLVGVALLPLAINFTRVLNKTAPNMCYSFLMVYVLCAVLLENAKLPRRETVTKVSMAVFAGILLINAQLCSRAYLSSATAHRATQTFATNLVSRVESTEGYRSGMEVVIIGTMPREVYHTGSDMFEPMEHASCTADTLLLRNKHIYYYLNDWLNIPWEEPSEDRLMGVSETEEFKAMPLYPDDGSVRIEGDAVIVKLAETYTPKKPYEIAYENRR